MKSLIAHKLFIGSFLATYFSFFLVTVKILEIKRDAVFEGHLYYGFPFDYYYSHCFGGYYIWSGLVGNIVFAIVLSVVIGIASTLVWLKILLPWAKKISSAEFRAKWHI